MKEDKAVNSQAGMEAPLPTNSPGLACTQRPRTNSAAFFIWGILLCTLLQALLPKSQAAISAASAESPVTEYEVKALYVYYFAKFVDWPQGAFPAKNSPITIGIFGDDPFGAMLDTIVKNKTIQEHPIAIRILKWPPDLRTCQLLYVSVSEQKRFSQISEALRYRPILTITEAEDNLQAKGILNLFIEGGKVQFEVDLARAEKAHLQISSKLLRLARGITGKNSEKGE
jgi:hypothetical protein